MPEMPSQSPPSALRADAARNRERIIAAAAAVFAERGLEAATAEIAHRAGVGEATLFRRFPTKDDLIDAIIETRMEEVVALADAAASDPDPAVGTYRRAQSAEPRRPAVPRYRLAGAAAGGAAGVGRDHADGHQSACVKHGDDR
jgi:AcrR family transcriptional regulator